MTKKNDETAKAKTKATKTTTATEAEKPVKEIDVRERTEAAERAKIEAIAAKYEFLDKPEERGKVEIEDIIFEEALDSRATPGVLDAPFLESLKIEGKPHLINPVSLAWVKVKETGKVGRLMVAGRRRTRGFVENGFAEIDAITRTYTLAQALVDSGQENVRRQAISAWDTAIYYSRLVASGMQQQQIAHDCGVSNATVSQTLSLLRLDPRVQTMMKAGKFGSGAATLGRELARIKDLDQQHEVALEVVADKDNIWSAAELQQYIKDLEEDAAKKAERKAAKDKAKKKAAKSSGGDSEEAEETEETEEETAYYFNVDDFAPVDTTVAHQLAERCYDKLVKIKTDEPDVITKARQLGDKNANVLAYVKEQGRLQGIKEAFGLAKIPQSVLKAAEEEAARE